MRNRLSQNLDLSEKEMKRKQKIKDCFCSYCPFKHNENANGSKSQWGRKVAAKQKYRTGKGRKEIDWNERPFWDLIDKHYEGMK